MLRGENIVCGTSTTGTGTLTLADANFDLAKFIRGGTVTGITATQVGTFLATITNNYRSLRSQISAATTLAILNAINLNAGWPANP